MSDASTIDDIAATILHRHREGFRSMEIRIGRSVKYDTQIPLGEFKSIFQNS